MSETAAFTRQWLLLRMLCSRSAQWTLKELARELEVSKKTIHRDFDVLRSVGFPLRESVGPRGLKTWRCETDGLLTGLTFTFEEAAALSLSRRFLEPLAGTILFDATHRAFRKIRSGLPKETLNYLEQLATALHQTSLGASDYADRADVIDHLMVAIEDRRVTRMLYHSLRRDQPADVEVHPYGLIWHRGTLYLVAFAPGHDEIRHYKIDRVRDVDVLPPTFDRPAEFNLQQHLGSTFGIYHGDGPPHTVRIRFAPAVTRYVQEHHWHETQTLTPHPDGRLTLEMQLSQLEEVKSWILSFGAQAEVEAPAQLREMITQDLATLAAMYGSNRRAKR